MHGTWCMVLVYCRLDSECMVHGVWYLLYCRLDSECIVHSVWCLVYCRLDSECRVHVSDGALAQEFHPDCYHTVYGAVRSVRWAAVETLQEGLCTARSNVVSGREGGGGGGTGQRHEIT